MSKDLAEKIEAEENAPLMRGQLDHWNPMRVSIERTPRVGDVFWIGNPRGTVEPEFDGYHPGVIIRGCPDLFEGTATVSFVPITSVPPIKILPSIHPLAANPNPNETKPVWAICTHIYTTRISRLERYFDSKRRVLVVPKLSAEDITAVFNAIRRGFTAFDKNLQLEVKSHIEKAQQELEAQFEARVATEVERRVFEEMDQLTRPNIGSSLDMVPATT